MTPRRTAHGLSQAPPFLPCSHTGPDLGAGGSGRGGRTKTSGAVLCQLRQLMHTSMGPGRGSQERRCRVIHPPQHSRGAPGFSPNAGGEDNSQKGLRTDVWDQLRICLFKSNFKY